MSDTLQFKGTWNPSIGAFPVITDDTTACYYLVSGAGHVDGYTFNQGDWLIYVEEPISPTETHGRWYHSEGGIVQVAPLQQSPTPSYSFGEPGTYTKLTVNNAGVVTRGDFLNKDDIPTHSQDAATITNFTPTARSAVGPMFVNTARSKAVQFEFDSTTRTVSADVRVDGVSIVKDEFGQLKVADSIAHASGGIDIDGDTLFPPEAHTHTSNDISDLKQAVRQALSHSVDGQGGFFANTARSNAVTFNYDVATATVSADVKVDNSTIVKNKYGQLVAIAADLRPHTHSIEEIAGIDIETIRSFRPASLQTLELPSDGTYTDGLYNLEGYQINDAFDVVNISLLTLTNNLTQLNVDIAAIKPVPPPSLADINLEPWDGYTLYTAAKAGSGEIIPNALFDKSPRTNVTPRFAGSSAGTLTAIIDGQENAAAAVLDEESDYYEGEPAYQGWYTSIRAHIYTHSNLTAGIHTLQLKYVENGKTTLSKVLEYHIAEAKSTAKVRVDSTNVMFSSLPEMTGYVSGVPTIQSRDFEIGSLRIDNAVGTFYNPSNILQLYGDTSGIDNENSEIWASPDNIPSINGYVEIRGIPFSIKNIYAHPVAFQTRCYDIFGNAGIEQRISTGRRFDPTSEALRVQSGDASKLHPTECGQPWDSSKSLVAEYSSELQVINSTIRWPEEDYSWYGGPDYTAATGAFIEGTTIGTPQYRWFTNTYTIKDLTAFDLHLQRIGSPWPLTVNRTIRDIFIFAQVVGQTGWVDLNKPFVGYGGVINTGDGALDVSKTTESIRRCTFGSGTGPFTGTLLIRIGFSKETNYRINSDISLVPAGY